MARNKQSREVWANPAQVRADQERRRSNAAGRHYTSKHPHRSHAKRAWQKESW
jgi:hypothetical protein